MPGKRGGVVVVRPALLWGEGGGGGEMRGFSRGLGPLLQSVQVGDTLLDS